MDRPALSRALWLAARVLPGLPSPLLKHLCRLAQRAMPLVRRQGTMLGILSLEAFDERGRLVGEIEVRARERGLDVPALPAVWAVRCFLERGAALPAGPLPSPLEINSIRCAGFSFSVNSLARSISC